jgi:hypothetical protein
LPPPKTSVVETVAGAVLGAVVGAVIAFAVGGALTILLGLTVGPAVGALFGLLVAKLSGRTGTLTVGNVLWAMPRILLWAIACPLLPLAPVILAVRASKRPFDRSVHDAADRLDRWDRDED